jgi:hypothetical protein
MLIRSARVRGLGVACLHAFALGCATPGTTTTRAPSANPLTEFNAGADNHPAVEMPAEAPEVRQNGSAPILSIVTIDEVVLPYVYGYPLYPEGDAARGIAELRRVSGEGAKHAQSTDRDGVVHVTEELPAIGCRFEGIRETQEKFVPMSLTCDLPAPKTLGGAKRPVLGAVAAGAKAEEVLKEPTVVENFLGAFHLISADFAGGSGTAFFNTTHGQIALVFKGHKLDHFAYYFDADVAGWRDSKSWEGLL